jgi:hypothetical protein
MTVPTTALLIGLALAPMLAVPVRAQEVWTGPVKQNPPAADFTVVLTLSDSGGETDYPELNCGGTLTRVGQSGAYSFYLEKITRRGVGCVDGAITLVNAKGMIAWSWVGVYDGTTLVAWSSLTKR